MRAADVELLSGSPEGHPMAKAARRWVAFDNDTRALHHLNDSSDFVAVQLHGAMYCQPLVPNSRGSKAADVSIASIK